METGRSTLMHEAHRCVAMIFILVLGAPTSVPVTVAVVVAPNLLPAAGTISLLILAAALAAVRAVAHGPPLALLTSALGSSRSVWLPGRPARPPVVDNHLNPVAPWRGWCN